MIYEVRGGRTEEGEESVLTSQGNYSCRSAFIAANHSRTVPLNRFDFLGVSTDPARVIATLKSSPRRAAVISRAIPLAAFLAFKLNANLVTPAPPPLLPGC